MAEFNTTRKTPNSENSDNLSSIGDRSSYSTIQKPPRRLSPLKNAGEEKGRAKCKKYVIESQSQKEKEKPIENNATGKAVIGWTENKPFEHRRAERRHVVGK